MAFMEPETTNVPFFSVENKYGETEYVPQDVFGTVENTARQYEVDESDVAAVDVGEGEGWFCRLQAPGYLDATEWTGPFDTEQEALDYLTEAYGDDEEESDDSEDSDYDCEESGHEYGEVEHSHITRNPHRKCLHCGFVSLDLSDDDSEDE